MNKRSWGSYSLAAACALNGIMFGAVKWFYEILPMPMHEILYCTFLGFTVTTAVGARRRELPLYLANTGIGLLWVAGYMGFEAVFLLTSLPDTAAKAAAFGLMSFVIEAVNMLALKRKNICIIPIQFAVVIGVFSQQGKHIACVTAALLIGGAAAFLSREIYAKVSENAKGG